MVAYCTSFTFILLWSWTVFTHLIYICISMLMNSSCPLHSFLLGYWQVSYEFIWGLFCCCCLLWKIPDICYRENKITIHLRKHTQLVQFSCSVMSVSLRPHGLQHARLPCPSLAPGACSNSCPLNRWCHCTISSSVVLFSSRLQSFPASGSFPMSQFFTSGGQNIGALASASVLPMDIQEWLPLGLTGLMSLLSKGLSRVFSNTTVQKHHFFGPLLSLVSNSHIHTWLLEKP